MTLASSDIAAHSLWQFSIERYAMPKVKEYSLIWQDMYHGNVNALFALLWVRHNQFELGVLDAPKWQHLVIQSQHVLVDPIRDERKTITDKSSEDYKFLLTSELEAEQRQQSLLVEYIIALQAARPKSQTHFEDYIEWHCTTQLHASQFHEACAHALSLAEIILPEVSFKLEKVAT